MYSLKEKVWRLALLSRLFIILLQCVSNLVVPDHDAQVFISPTDPKDAPGICDYIVSFLFGGFLRWDAQYFLHITKYGYTYENCLAFFPLLPSLAHLLTTTILSPFTLFFTLHSLFVLSFVAINLFCFAKAALVLFDLSLIILRDEEMAYRSSIFFCLNPASIFFTAPYSESLYAFFTFSGFLCSATHKSKTSILNFGLACATRSNGILNIGFILHKQLRSLYHSMSTKTTVLLCLIPMQIVGAIIPLALSVGTAILPFVLFQIFSFGKFCIDDKILVPQFITEHSKENNLKLAGSNPSEWCNSSVPLAYSYVQDHYWNVGFLKYFQFKQLPNFILAMPIIWMIVHFSVVFIQHYPRHCMLLGFPYTKIVKKVQGIPVPPPEAFLYVAHALCLLLFCTFCIHVQVTTRMLASSSPVLYWAAAYLSWPYTKITEQKTEKSGSLKKVVETKYNLESSWEVFFITETPTHLRAKIIKIYFALYLIVGTILFSNYFPWT